MKYRRKYNTDTWHFCKNCSNWQTSDYAERDDKPTVGELCDECKGKDRSRNCQKDESS